LRDQIASDLRLLPNLVGGQAARVTKRIEDALATLCRLTKEHNRYYPIEANLPMDPKTGRMLERGEAWRPLPLPTLESLRGSRR
jgi:hypothetical protein